MAVYFYYLFSIILGVQSAEILVNHTIDIQLIESVDDDVEAERRVSSRPLHSSDGSSTLVEGGT